MARTRAAPDVAAVAEILADPVRFAEIFLGHTLWPTQAAILRSVRDHARTAVKACHASSKTFTAAEALLWWVTAHTDGIVVTTAPTWIQVEKVLWGEVHKAVASSKIDYPPLLKTELRLGPNRYAMGLSTNEGVRFQGFHGRVLVIVDEAPGVDGPIWDAIEGIRAGGDVRLLALGNPIVAGGPFYDAFTVNRDNWTTFTISAFDTPNLGGISLAELVAMDELELARNPLGYLVSRAWVREKYEEWGPESALYVSKVLGEFPSEGPDSLISLLWLEAAAGRGWSDHQLPCEAGVDVAGPGEAETAATVREDQGVLASSAWHKADARGDVAAFLEPFKARLTSVRVDAAGIGWYMARHLEDLGYNVVDVNAGSRALDSDRFVNRKAEMYWNFRALLSRGEVANMTDDVAIAQASTVRYDHDARGRVRIETKEEAVRRGVRSPDRFESYVLAFAGESWDGTVPDWNFSSNMDVDSLRRAAPVGASNQTRRGSHLDGESSRVWRRRDR